MAHLRIGVANSISFNFQYDPLDTIAFARQSNFELLQIYLSEALLKDDAVLQQILSCLTDFDSVFFHGEGFLNQSFSGSAYEKKLNHFLTATARPNIILHFDEREKIDTLVRLTEEMADSPVQLYLENYFFNGGKEEAERNIKKYLALFTLTQLSGKTLLPVLDIPRLFHKKLGFETAEALEWCYQMINFFSNRRIPLLLHLIDATAPEQGRLNYCAIGSGYIPYEEIFAFISKTRPDISGIILEFEDKMNPLASREFIEGLLET